MDRTVAIKIKAETNKVFLKFSGLPNPKSFHDIFRALILHVAMINVENDQKRPFAIKLSLGKYISLIRNITEMYITRSIKKPFGLFVFEKDISDFDFCLISILPLFFLLDNV